MLNQKTFKGKYTEQIAPSLYTTKDLVDDYQRTSSGHFFDKGAMRFFNSRVQGFLRGDGSQAYFVTSERYDKNAKRMFTIRQVTRKKSDNFHGYKYDIETVFGFQSFKSVATAKRHIEKLLKGDK